MQSAVNPKTGEVLFLVNDQWVKPAQTAINPKTGENAYLVDNAWQTMPMPKPAGGERTWGEALVTDPIASLLSGTGTALGSPGQLKQLITGEKPAEEKPKGTIESLAQSLLPFGTDLSKIPEKALEKLTPTAPTMEGVTGAAVSPFQKLQPVGEELEAFGKKQQSAGLKAAEKGREKAIQEAEGFLPEIGAAVGQTLKNPALLTNFIFEQIPNFAGTLGGGALSKQAAKAFFKDATEKTLGKVGVGGAVATGGAMQAGDIGAETYQTIYDRLVKEGTPSDEAHQIALEKGRMAAAQAGAISVASSFIPGGKALERRFLTDAGKKAGFPGLVPAVGNVLGETIQEGTEEGGGKLASNIQVADVFPDTDIMKGVGAATGLGALGGGMFGGISNVPSALSRAPQVEPTPPGGAVPPGAPPAVPPTPAVPLEAQLEETPAAVRLAELERAMQEVDAAFQNPNLSADDFRQLNAMAAQIKTQIAKVQAGEPVTAVTPPIPPVTPQAAAPEAPPVQVPEVPVVETPVAENLTVTPVTPEVAAPVEVAPTAEETLAKLKADQAAAKVSKEKREVIEEPPETLDSTNPENIKKAETITAKYQNNEDVSREESDFHLAVMRDVMSKEEKLKSPPISKKSVIPIASIEVAPFNGGYVSSFSYNEFTKGLGIGTPLDINTIYPTRQEAIDAVAKEVRDRAEKDGNKTALKWLDTVATPAAVPTPEKTKAEINKERQAEKKAAAEKAKQPVDTSAVPDADKIRKKNGYVIYKRKSDMDYWRVQSVENKLANRIGEGDSAHSDLGTAEDKIYNNINEEESKPKAESKPKIEEIVSPQVAASMRDIEFQNKLIKANKEQTITKNQFSRLFKLYQDGKTAQADEQLTKMLTQNEKKAKAKEVPEEEHIEGKTSEPVTSNTIEDAIDKAKTKVDVKKIKSSINNQFEQAIKRAKILTEKDWASAKGLLPAEKFVTIDIPGDGKFKVKNNSERLKELQKRLIAALPLKTGKPTRKPSAASVSAPETAFANMVNEGDMENALEYARVKKMVPTNAGLTPQGIKNLEKALGGEKGALEFKAEIEGKPTEEVETYQESMDRINAKMKAEGRESEFSKAAKELADTKAKIADLEAKRETSGQAYMRQASDDYNKVVDESYDGKKNDTDVLANQSLDRYIPFDKLVDIIKNAENVLLAPEQLKMRFGVQKAADAQRVIQAVRKAKNKKEGPFYNNFEPDFTQTDFDNSVDDVRKEKIKEQATLSRRITKSVKKIADMGSDLTTQYELNRTLKAKEKIAEEIAAMKQLKILPEDVMAKAGKDRAEFVRTGGLDGLSPEAYAVLEALYKQSPDILNGLTLSVRATERRGVTGSFDPIERLVTVYKKGISAIFGGAGEKQAKTMRHEIAHSLEQMMNSDAKQVLVNAWANSLQKAIKKHEGDKVYQDYFNAVLDFIENPNESTYKKATDLMPEYSMYQYINPSEYWAVNAEPLLNAQLGGAWARFTKAVKGLWEAIKSVFGFDNRYAVHREFNRIMSGDQQRINKQMLVEYLDQTGVSKKFINNIEEERSLVEDLNLPEVPNHQDRNMKDMAVAGYRRMQEWGKEFGSNPGKTATKSLISASDAVTKQRIENVYFAAGTDKRDQDRYNGQIRAADGFMAASVAIKNAIHSAAISTRVIIEGGIEYSKELGQIVAVKSEHSMGNVFKLEHAIKQKLGDKLGLQIVNGYFIAKRSRSIQNEFLDASAALQKAQDSGDFAQIADAQSDYNSIKTAYGKIPNYFRQLDQDGKPMYETIYGEDGEVLGRIPILNDEAIDRAIDMEKLHPELKQMMENWTAVNHDMLDIMAFSGRISKKSAEKLKAIKDYVPWYRIMDDQENIHDGSLISNYPGGPKKFKAGETERDIDNVVESMIHNVVMMTRSATKTYAINRVISEYGQRYEDGPKKGKLMVFPSEGRDAEGTRIASFIGGRRVILNIPDDLVADSVIGLIAAPFTFPLQEVLGAAANGFRRSITFTPWFQVKQLIIDAPTAAWVSGVRNPFKLWAGCFKGFYDSLELTGDDPVVQILKNAGVGGFQSFHRSAKKEREIQLGLLQRSNYAKVLNFIDKIGDASDLAQRVAVYKRVLAEKGDPALALLQASDIIDFQKHGKGRLAQAMRTTVTFMQAYATQIDALAQASVGGNLKGVSRAEAKKQFQKTGMLLAGTTLMYVFMAAADDDYWELDDQTRLRNFYIPGSKKATGHHILIPMTTSAAFFFKAVPELAHNFIVSQGTKNEMDKRRTAKALGAAAVDALLGPSPVPTGVKPIAEIAFNHDFYTGTNVVPKGLEGLDSAEQYNATTSNLGHAVSKLSGGALNPIQADHIMRGIGGSVAALGMYFSNLAFPDDRPAPELRQNPIIGNLVAPEVSRKNEELFYDLREKATGKYKTYQSMMENDRFDEADKFYEKNQGLIDVYEYVSSIDTDLKEINKEVRRLGKSSDKSLTPAGRTKDINELKRLKSDMLEDITEFRKEAGF